MRHLSFFALAASAACAVAFSPGLGLVIALVVLVAMSGDLPLLWLKSLNFVTVDSRGDHLTGHGHLQAEHTGAGGRHGPPRTISFVLMLVMMIWALILATCRRLGHVVSKFLILAGRFLANINTSPQPSPS